MAESEANAVSEEWANLREAADKAGHKIQVYVEDPRTREWSFVKSVRSAGFDLDKAREMFGGGRFQFRLVDERGRYVKGKTVTHRIAAPDRELWRAEPQDEDEDEGTDSEVERLRAELQELKREEREGTTLELLRGLTDEVKRLREELRNPPRGTEQANPADMALSIVEALRSSTEPYVRALLEKAESSGDPSEAAMEAFFRGLEAQERIASGSEYREVIREIGKPLVGMLKENERRERALPAGGREPEDPAEGRQEPAGAGEGREDEARGPLRPEWYVTFEGVIPQFLGWARAGSDPADRAGQVIFNLPDDYVRVLAKAVEDPDFIEEFVAYVPEADDHRPWLREFFADLRDTFYGTEEPVQEPEAGAQGPEPDPEPQGPGAPDREPAFEPDPDPEPVSGGD